MILLSMIPLIPAVRINMKQVGIHLKPVLNLSSKLCNSNYDQRWFGRENQVPKCETSLACLYLTALGVLNGVGLGLGWVCVQLLTPVIAARFDVFFNVVLCCSLFMYILIKK